MNEIETDLTELGQRLWPDDSVLHPRGAAAIRPPSRRRSALLTILVGTATAAILAGVLAGGVVLLGQSKRVAPAVTKPAATQAASIYGLEMVSASDGWGWSSRLIARTTDGAATFTNATPHDLTSGQNVSIFTAVDMLHAWAVIASSTQTGDSIVYHAWLYRTTNGGVTWRSELISPDAGGLMFVDALHGWATIGTISTAPTNRLELLRTVDGGATWSQVYATTFVDGNPCEFSPTFVTPTFGVATFGGCETPFMTMTTDGGVTWRRVALPNPAAGREPAMITQVDAVNFTSPRSGSVFLTVCPPSEAFCDATGAFYRTTDGGVTWTPTTVIRGTDGLIILPGGTVWAPQACLVPCGDSNGIPHPDDLLVTTDGGQHWTGEQMPVFTGEMPVPLLLYFATSKVGFAVNVFGGHPVGVPETYTYYRTSDAGETWVQFWPRLRG